MGWNKFYFTKEYSSYGVFLIENSLIHRFRNSIDFGILGILPYSLFTLPF